MAIKGIQCPICGNTEMFERVQLTQCEELRCGCCDTTLTERLAKNEYQKIISGIEAGVRSMGALVTEAIVKEKFELFANRRAGLVKAVKADYVDSKEIVRLCNLILDVRPGDFLAEFFKVANSSTYREVAEYISGIDEEENAAYMELVLDFITRSLRVEYINPTAALLERCSNIFAPEVKQKCYTRFEAEAGLVKAGIYETGISRDVFLAYSGKDMKVVKNLVDFLESDEIGLTCFAAYRNLQHGRDAVANYEKALREAMDNCSIFLFVSSVNSRSFICDAFKVEMAYIRNSEMNKHPECRNYAQLPDKYKKLRVEYRLDNKPTPLADRNVREFFAGLTYVEDYAQLTERLGDCMRELTYGYEETDSAEVEANLKAEIEAKIKADYEAKLKVEVDARRRAEEDAKCKAAELEAKLKAEAEAKRKAEAEAKRKAEEEKLRKALEEIKSQAAKNTEATQRITEHSRKNGICAEKIKDITLELEKINIFIDTNAQIHKIQEQQFEVNILNVSDCRRKEYDNGYYVGQLKFGKEHGYGTHYWNSGSYYKGEFLNGEKTGYGKYCGNDGYRYEGEWKNNKSTGVGTYYYTNGNRYEGYWDSENKSGTGTYYWSNGNTFKGMWQNGVRNGYGAFDWVDGSHYEGEFLNGDRTGYGTLHWSSGNRYEGEFVKDKRTGYGTFYWKQGDRYQGDFVEDKKDGYGTLFYTNGDRYEGDWKADERTGHGVYYYADGDRYEGTYVSNQRVGFGSLYCKQEGATYSGNWTDLNNATDVIKTDANGKTTVGEYIDGEFVPR